MRKDKHYKLLVEITKLIVEYGNDTFNNLGAVLKDEANLKDISDVILEVSKNYNPPKKSSTTKKNSKKKELSIDDLLSKIKEENKRQFLKDTYYKIMGKKIFQHGKDLEYYGIENNLPKSKMNPRKKGALTIIEDLKDKSIEVSEKILENYQVDDERGLQNWSEMILKE